MTEHQTFFRLTRGPASGEGFCSVALAYGLKSVLDQDRFSSDIEVLDIPADGEVTISEVFADWADKYGELEETGIFKKSFDHFEDFYAKCFCSSADLSKPIYF